MPNTVEIDGNNKFIHTKAGEHSLNDGNTACYNLPLLFLAPPVSFNFDEDWFIF